MSLFVDPSGIHSASTQSKRACMDTGVFRIRHKVAFPGKCLTLHPYVESSDFLFCSANHVASSPERQPQTATDLHALPILAHSAIK